nr:phosphomevalonate kinase [Quercus suber]
MQVHVHAYPSVIFSPNAVFEHRYLVYRSFTSLHGQWSEKSGIKCRKRDQPCARVGRGDLLSWIRPIDTATGKLSSTVSLRMLLTSAFMDYRLMRRLVNARFECLTCYTSLSKIFRDVAMHVASDPFLLEHRSCTSDVLKIPILLVNFRNEGARDLEYSAMLETLACMNMDLSTYCLNIWHTGITVDFFPIPPVGRISRLYSHRTPAVDAGIFPIVCRYVQLVSCHWGTLSSREIVYRNICDAAVDGALAEQGTTTQVDAGKPASIHLYRTSKNADFISLRPSMLLACNLYKFGAVSMVDRTVAISAPGKVFLAGGYLVLDRSHDALVFALDARIHILIRDIPTTRGVILSEIVVHSPQFLDAVWEYGYRRAERNGGVHVTQLRV